MTNEYDDNEICEIIYMGKAMFRRDLISKQLTKVVPYNQEEKKVIRVR